MVALRSGVVVLALIALVWPAEPPGALGLAGSEWRVMEVAGIKSSAAGTLRFTQTSIRGRSGCHAFSGSFRESHGRIEIAGIIPANEATSRQANTSTSCRAVLSLERSLLEALGRAAAYRRDGGTLMLIDVHGRSLARLSG